MNKVTKELFKTGIALIRHGSYATKIDELSDETKGAIKILIKLEDKLRKG